MLVNVVSIICCAIFAIVGLFVVAKIVFKMVKDRKEAISYIRSFKKGKCALILLPVFALYWVGFYHSDGNVIRAFYASIENALGFLVMKYDLDDIDALMQANALYKHTVYAGMLLVLLNAMLFAFSWLGQYLVCGAQRLIDRCSNRDRLVLVGNSPENIAIYHSDKKRRKLLLEDVAAVNASNRKKEEESLYMNGVAFQFANSLDAEIEKRICWARRRNKECLIIVNTGDDKRNIGICKTIVQKIAHEKSEIGDIYKKLNVYVFGDPKYETVYADAVNKGNGCVHYVNKYMKVAMDFVDRYPFSQFMDERQIDYETTLIRDGVDINAILIGFGRANQQIFLTSVANNQFLTGSEAEPKLKAVNYVIFDKTPAENNKNLNHSYYRFKNECCDENGKVILDEENYLDPPELPAKETYHHLDINDQNFYRQIQSVVTRNKNDANFIIIAFGADLENLDLAQKLIEKRKEWGLDNLTIFVKARAWHKENSFQDDAACYFIGNERDVVYNIDKITNDIIYKMSQERDVFYKVAKEANGNSSYEELCTTASRAWHMKKTQIERESSLYCCLSLRSKLQLMGLDYCTEREIQELGLYAYSQKAYWEYVASDDMPQNSMGEGQQPKIIFSDLNFKQSRRRTMAIHEHMRWNSYMLSKGMIPATIKQIEELEVDDKGRYINGKNYPLRRHGNLTTFEGLMEFRRIVGKKPDTDEKNEDVIQYDYQILDDAYWLLRTQGYKIVDKKALQEARKNKQKEQEKSKTVAIS